MNTRFASPLWRWMTVASVVHLYLLAGLVLARRHVEGEGPLVTWDAERGSE